jgi:hypothetical protein
MVEKWWAIAFKYFGKEKLDGELGKNSLLAKKRILQCFQAISCLKENIPMKTTIQNEIDEFRQSWMQI